MQQVAVNFLRGVYAFIHVLNTRIYSSVQLVYVNLFCNVGAAHTRNLEETSSYYMSVGWSIKALAVQLCKN